MTARSEHKQAKRKRPRTRRGRAGAPDSAVAPVRALSASGPALSDKPLDDPLSALEVAQMKEHFRFLRQHRKLLKLRLNATEDLLLNGVREPTHRGVCQHLLAKVEKERVLAVSERLSPLEAAKLLAGVLRFAPELGYVLRYLMCLSQTDSQPAAAAALGQALRRIQFHEASSAQMRQVLALIDSVFPRDELPVLLFNWLDNPEFREAFDRSHEALPEPLAQNLRPLRALHRVLGRPGTARGQRPRASLDPDSKAGLGMLLAAARSSLGGLPREVRRRLFEVSTKHASSLDTPALRGLAELFASLQFASDDDRTQATLGLASAMLATGEEAQAIGLLEKHALLGDGAEQARRWLRALRGPRLGPIALEVGRTAGGRRRSRGRDGGTVDLSLEPNRWHTGFFVPTQQRVRVRFGEPGDRRAYREQLELWNDVLVPGVLRPLLAETDTEQPYLAVLLKGRRLRLANGTGSDSLGLCIELCEVLGALAHQGIALPDPDPDRFSVDDAGRLWLVDLFGSERVQQDVALERHANIAASLVAELCGAEPSSNGEGRSTLRELVRQLQEH